MTFAPFMRLHAAPWFDRYGSTLTDATSYRHIIAGVECEREQNANLLLLMGHDPVDELDRATTVVDVRDADALLAKLRARLEALLGGAP